MGNNIESSRNLNMRNATEQSIIIYVQPEQLSDIAANF